MKGTYKLAAVATLAILTGCDYFLPGNQELTTTRDYSSDYEGDKLVLSGYISDRHGVFAELRHSVRPETPNAPDTVSDAEVHLLRDGEPYATLRRNAKPCFGPYVGCAFSYMLAPGEADIERGHTYSLRATSPTYGTAQSHPDVLPEAVVMDSVWASTYYDGTYYGFNAAYSPAHAGQTVYPMAIQYRDGTALFYKFFDYDRTVKCISASPTSTTVRRLSMPQNMDSASIEIMTLSDGTADYLQSLSDYYESLDDDAYDYPLSVRQNVDGGYGFVGAFASSALTIVADSVNQMPDIFDDDDDYLYDRYFDSYY